MKQNLRSRPGLVPLLCTLLLLTLGLSMPGLTAAFLDHQLTKDISVRDNIHVSLDLSQSENFLNTLVKFDARQSQIELTENYRMTEDEVRSAAAEIAGKFDAALTRVISGKVSDNSMGEIKEQPPGGASGSSAGDADGSSGLTIPYPEVTPLLIANKDDPSLSGVFWQCLWAQDDSDKQTIMWLDDQSGLMVAFQSDIRIATITTSDTYVELNTNAQAASALADFCRSYYPIEDVQLIRPQAGVEEYVSNYYLLALVKNDGEQTVNYTVPLRFRDHRLYFNL